MYVKKLKNYKKDQPPSGTYWNPSDENKQLLQQLIPNNDM